LRFITQGKCSVCSYVGEIDLHHLKSRKSGGPDTENNLIELCREHHVAIHSLGRTTFIKIHKLEDVMIDKGWELINNKWILPKENK